MKKVFISMLAIFYILFQSSILTFADREEHNQVVCNGITVSANAGDKYITIETDNNTLRVYRCGKVEKLDWKEINPNEEADDVVEYSIVDPPYIVEDYIYDRYTDMYYYDIGAHDMSSGW